MYSTGAKVLNITNERLIVWYNAELIISVKCVWEHVHLSFDIISLICIIQTHE